MATTKRTCMALMLTTLLVTLGGATTQDNYCQVAGPSCLYFDGNNDYVNLGSGLNLTSGNMSIMAWTKMDAGNSGQWMGIAGKMVQNTNRGYVLARYSTNQFAFMRGNGSGIFATLSGSTYTDTEWHHVAAVMNGSISTMYVDGVTQPYTGTSSVVNSSGNAFIGRHYSDTTDRLFKGMIDDVRFYSRSLNAVEIGSAMTTLPAGDPDLAGYWNLNEATGTFAFDSSGHSQHGQLAVTSGSGGPTWTSTNSFCYVAPPLQVTISGTITTSPGGLPLAGVTVTINPSLGSDTTNGAGFYSMTVPYGFSGTISPSKAGYAFTPSVRTYNNLTSNSLNNNYTAAPVVTTYYVSTTGNDGNSGVSPALAFKTIQRGLNVAIAGDTVIVLDGTYTGTGNRSLDFNGKNLTLKSQNGPHKTVIDCQNSARALYFHSGETAQARVQGFTLKGGRANQGGAIYCLNSSPIITRCHLLSNTSNQTGGAVYGYNSDMQLLNCLLADNVAAGGAGGALYYDNGFKQPVITNCTVADNTAAGAGGGLWCRSTYATVKNSIFWGNQAALGGHQLSLTSATLTVQYCDVAGGKNQVQNSSGSLVWGAGNLDLDPVFGDPGIDDYYLKSERGRYYPTLSVWILDNATSPCIDAGNPTDSVGDERQPHGDRINMGAYGGTTLASRTHVPCELVKDENQDSVIDYNDLFLLIDHWLTQWNLISTP